MTISHARAKELFDYDPKSGELRWKVGRSNIRSGSLAGTQKRNYIVVSIDNKLYRAHKIVWLLMTGKWPKSFIDHRDLNKKNNSWANLRLATKSQNMSNRRAPKNNTSGFKGVSPYRAGKRFGKPWQSGIQVNGHKIHIGHFATPKEAAGAYAKAAKKYFGEFWRAT